MQKPILFILNHNQLFPLFIAPIQSLILIGIVPCIHAESQELCQPVQIINGHLSECCDRWFKERPKTTEQPNLHKQSKRSGGGERPSSIPFVMTEEPQSGGKDTCSVMHDSRLWDTLISYNLKSLTPKAEVQHFGGDITQYYSFVWSFDRET